MSSETRTGPFEPEAPDPGARRIRLVIAYHGAAYRGWQIQSSVPSVQGAVVDAVERVTGGRRPVCGASRTDAGVHALGQVAAFDDDGRRTVKQLFHALNHLTPDDIWVRSVDEVPHTFHPRHSARGKIYEYRIETRLHRSPFLRDRAMHYKKPLDIEAMNAAAAHLVGRHDFTTFRASGCAASSPVRELWEIRVEQEAADVIRVRVAGSAFLKYMVRSIVGTLIEVGRGRRSPDWMAEALASREREYAGPTAPPEGLTLVRVFHPGFPVEMPT